ncbi:MAG: T9SS type A sorting domain-containing protein [Saprospiraceae bacterium]|nr:T9SS type A sorting domain-containing protein [Saprospiraceae bacterium]
MNLFKCLQLLTCVVFIHFSANISAQTWTACGATSGLLDGSTTSLYLTDTTVAPVPTTNPSPSNTIPNTEFVVMLHDSMASDNMGWAIIASSLDGQVSPASLGLSVGDTFSLALFSYDIQQIKLAVQAILHNSPIFGTGDCCSTLDNAAPSPGVCDSLNAAGIMDSSDVNDMTDLLSFLGAFSGGGSTSLAGLNLALGSINASIGLLSAVGCTNGVNEICYATDSMPSNHSHFIVSSMTNNTKLEGSATLKIAVNPNPFLDQISTGISTENGGEHTLRIFDATGRIVYVETNELSVGEQMITLNLGNLTSGVYYLQVTGNNNIVTQKIVKR